jgi:hypothetical protein
MPHRRNTSCIGCGCPRASNGPASPQLQNTQSPSRSMASPRFATPLSAPTCFSSTTLSQTPSLYSHPGPSLHTASASLQFQNVPKPAGASHPLLTPSGRAFSSGGHVQNVSSDPSTPCIMYWPDNEPLPEQGQIRPGSLNGMPVRLDQYVVLFCKLSTVLSNHLY